MTNAASSGRLERTLSRILKAGALTSTGLLAVGLLLELAGIDPALAAALTRAGLMVLMATPVARVVASVAEYAAERDWLFFALTGSVLVILVGSLLVAVQ
jgi:uncharacterized membrane protein